MRMAFHFFKRDFRRIWWLLALWFIIYTVEALQATLTTPRIFEWRQGFAAMSLTFLVFPGLHLIVLALVVAFVVYADPPADGSAFWITRPVSRLELLLSKTATLAVLVLVPVIATTLAVARFLPTTASLSLAVMCAVGHKLYFIISLAAMTAIVPNLRWYGVAILGIAAFIVASLVTGYLTSGSSLLIDPYDAAALRTTKAVICDMLLVAGGGFVFAYQYLRRRPAYSVRIAALVAAAYFAVSHFWPWSLAYSRQLPSGRAPTEATSINLKASAASTSNFNLNGVVSTGIDGPVEIEGIPKEMYYVVRTSSPRLKLSNGTAVKTLDGIPVVHSEELSPSALSSVGIGQFFHDGAVDFGFLAADFQFRGLSHLAGQIAHLPCHALKQLADGHQAHGHGSLLQFGGDARQLGQIALQAGTLQSSQVGVVAHHGLRDHQLSGHVHQIVQLPGVHFYGFSLFGWCLRPAGARSGGGLRLCAQSVRSGRADLEVRRVLFR